MPFEFGGVLKDLSCKHLFQHSTRLSWSLLNPTTFLFMQELANSIRNSQFILLRSTWVLLLLMRIYRPHCIDNVWCELRCLCTLSLGILSLNVTRMNHCVLFNSAWPEGASIFTWGWGYHPSRGRTSLFSSRWGSMYAEVTSSPHLVNINDT